ncbi:MAG: Folylpolyglutamate synthetase [Claussenomyces sp. TS43310]|nr:MAG: Folylpolyglutamate synthetase [Claussenomyces sp. TS43310]
MSTSPQPCDADRSYARCLLLLDKLASNRTVVSMIGSSAKDMNAQAMPEMFEWVRKAGYAVEDFNKLRAVHVAGTKGKGSVCAMVSTILQQYSARGSTTETGGLIEEKKGLGKIGLYTSPHLITPRERIRIDQVPLSQELFARYFFELWDRFSASAAAEHHPDPTSPETKPGYFRYLTIMAFHVFLQEGVETAVVECGIGGEYDSTNILQKAAVTVGAITKLGIDHVGMLGQTIESIAWHKAGIFKNGVKALTVPQQAEAIAVLEQRAQEIGCPLKTVSRRKDLDSGKVKLGLEGDFQKDNASLAVEVAGTYLAEAGFGGLVKDEDLPDEFIKALKDTRWEGRCEIKKLGRMMWCIDGAHTLDSVEHTAKWFAGKLAESKQEEGQAILLFNQQDRDGPALLKALNNTLKTATGMDRIFQSAIFCANTPFKPGPHTEAELQYQDLAIQKKMAKAWDDIEPECPSTVLHSVQEAMASAEAMSQDKANNLVLVTGSLHLVGAFLKVSEAGQGSD